MRTRRRVFTVSALALLALAGVGWLALGELDRAGRRFYDRGRETVEALDRVARALEAGDLAALSALYGPAYAGPPLGLTALESRAVRDGIDVERFAPGIGITGTTGTSGTLDRAAAVAEWGGYLADFEEVEAVGVHLHRLRAWDGDAIEAEARFELTGRTRPTADRAARPAIDRALFRVRFVRGAEGGLRIDRAELIEGGRVSADRPGFANVAAAAGVDFVNRYYPAFLEEPLRFGMIRYGPGGIAAADYDGDGFYDLFVPDGVEARLFRNLAGEGGDGRFADVTAEAGLAGLDGVATGVFADYDNDGRRDLFVSRTFRPNQLFHNEGPDAAGRVRFRDATAGSGLGGDCCTTVASWGDYDGDGRLDLFLGRYLDPRTGLPPTLYARNGEPDRLYHNDGDGRFRDVTAAAGVGDPGYCLGSAWGDYDDDGDPDLYLANDFGRNALYRNDGDGTFTDVTAASGTLDYGAGMSVAWGDYDGDGRLDLYVANIRTEHAWLAEPPTVGRTLASAIRQGTWTTDLALDLEIFRQSGGRLVAAFRQMASGNTLFRNRGDGTFEDATWAAGANPVGWFWGSSFGDLDDDGLLDLYSADGWVYGERGTDLDLDFLTAAIAEPRRYKSGELFDPARFGGRSWHGWERNAHLLNLGDGTFAEVGRAAGTDLLVNSRGVALADFWNRGVLDVAVAASDDRHALLRNESGGGRHWLEVELVGIRSNRDGVGARVTVVAGGRRLVREVTAGDGYASQNMLRLHFGLGAAATAEEVVIRWPASGTVQSFRDVAADHIIEVTEGGQLVVKRYGSEGGER